MVSQSTKLRVVLAFPAGAVCRSLQRADMGQLRDRAAQILPDADKHPSAGARIQLGQGATQIRPRYPGDRQPRSDSPRHVAAEIGGGRGPERAGNADAHPQRRGLYSIPQGWIASVNGQRLVSLRLTRLRPLLACLPPLAVSRSDVNHGSPAAAMAMTRL